MRKISIHGWIELPSPQSFDGATATVGLDDVTLIDALSTRIAETVIEGISGRQDRIPFHLEARWDFRARDSYVLAAEIRRSGRGRAGPGDFLTTVAVPWTVERTDGNSVPVTRI
ncbi:YbaY family lipoprotein [Bradyrhizobium lablabi]|nr:YbaY family lipoprotein [Bradyrhizobium lablabi]